METSRSKWSVSFPGYHPAFVDLLPEEEGLRKRFIICVPPPLEPRTHLDISISLFLREASLFLISPIKKSPSLRSRIFCFLVCAEGKQSDGSCSLDSEVDFTLMFCACSGYAARKNLTSFGNETAKCSDVFVINGVYVIYAALADLSSRSSGSISSDHASLSSKINVYQNGISSSLEVFPN